MRLSRKILIGIIIFILVITVVYTVIFCIKGSYPTEIYLALVPTCVTELVLLYKLKIKESESDGNNGDNEKQN